MSYQQIIQLLLYAEHLMCEILDLKSSISEIEILVYK